MTRFRLDVMTLRYACHDRIFEPRAKVSLKFSGFTKPTRMRIEVAPRPSRFPAAQRWGGWLGAVVTLRRYVTGCLAEATETKGTTVLVAVVR